MIPRLTSYGRNRVNVGFKSERCFASRPSPAERLRQRRKARASAFRWDQGRMEVEKKLFPDHEKLPPILRHHDRTNINPEQ